MEIISFEHHRGMENRFEKEEVILLKIERLCKACLVGGTN